MGLLIVKLTHAQSGDEGVDMEALQKTQKLLETPKLRKTLIENDKNAGELDKKIVTLTKGSETLNQDIYSISSDVFVDLLTQSAGDEAKLQELLERAKTDPKAFYDSLTPEQKVRVRNVAGQIELNDVAKAKK